MSASQGTTYLSPRALARHIEPLLLLEQLGHALHDPGGTTHVVLGGVDLAVARGEHVAIIGAAGAGRSTLLHLAAGLEPPTSGRVTLDGVALGRLDDAARAAHRLRTVGLLWSPAMLFDELTAAENVTLPMLLAGMPARAAAERATILLERVAVPPSADVAGLGADARARVGLARALANDPPLLLADEPTLGLDHDASDRFLGLLEELNADGLTLIIATASEAIGSRAPRRVHFRDGTVDREEELAA